MHPREKLKAWEMVSHKMQLTHSVTVQVLDGGVCFREFRLFCLGFFVALFSPQFKHC